MISAKLKDEINAVTPTFGQSVHQAQLAAYCFDDMEYEIKASREIKEDWYVREKIIQSVYAHPAGVTISSLARGCRLSMVELVKILNDEINKTIMVKNKQLRRMDSIVLHDVAQQYYSYKIYRYKEKEKPCKTLPLKAHWVPIPSLRNLRGKRW